MVTETQKRIEAYRELLPGLREKVTAVAFLLALSVIMLTSASYAWLTISRAPEVTAVSTNIAANGSLEIALATGDGKTAPGESKVGDSMAAEVEKGVNPITRANVTWGNLINLSDPSYGLDKLVLRPAQLNTASLLDSPLYGSQFGGDGRVTQLSSNFGYTSWVPPEGEKPGYFGVSDEVGVRAISSTTIEVVGAEAMYLNMVTEANNQNLAAANMYVALGTNTKYMPSLATMMGLYMTARMNPSNAELSNPTCKIEDIENLRDMYAAFLDCFDAEAEAMAKIANLTLFLLHGEGNYTPYTVDMIYATTTNLGAEGIQITDFDQFIKDRKTIATDLEKLNVICSSGTSLKWKDSGLNDIVNNLVDVGKCTIGANNTPISSIGASNAMNYLSGTQEAKITNGILYRFEERTGGYIQVKNLSIKATVERKGITIPASVKANVQTTASRDYNLFGNDLEYAKSLNDGDYKGGVAVAEDTYGLAVDFWVRTNSAESYLTLEGNVLTEEKEVRATGKDADGNKVDLYTVTISAEDEEGNKISSSMDLYQVVGDDRKVTWYNIDNYAVVTEEELGGSVPKKKMETVVTVTGYEGENRVWGENQMISPDATTQGSGSCYVYYADTPEDMERSLKLLEAFNVAFVDEDGKLMATAVMDTEKYYAQSGRVTVPLVLSTSDSINLGMVDIDGNTIYAITPLDKNTPTRITAIVYLDGTKLTNSEVLSAADIQGQLNIQFGSSKSLEPIENEDLVGKEIHVTATVDPNEFEFSKSEPMTAKVTVNVAGYTPTNVTAFFTRVINRTQGSREYPPMQFRNEDGKWVAEHTFEFPGKYVLRTVSLDGVDYDLDVPQNVEIPGFSISSLSYKNVSTEDANHINVMTAENTTEAGLTLQFADTEGITTSKVQGRFIKESDGSAVNVDFTLKKGATWEGTATFHTSGDYAMEYLVIDGKYMEIPEGMRKTANVTLGMRVAVYTTSPHRFKYVPSEMAENEKLLAMQVTIMDNAGNELPGRSGVKLIYGLKGSGVKEMDADLTWDGEYYAGELTTTGPGIWQFNKVEVKIGEKTNNLTVATESPTFTIQSPEPPEYVRHNTSSYQYAPNNDAKMNVLISNSSAATVQAYIIKNGAAEGTWVDGVLSNETTTGEGKPANYWNFNVPKDANGYQDGHWTLTQLKIWDVFAADGTAYTQEAPLEIDVSNENNKTKVVSRAFVSFAEDKSQNFGKDANGNVTATFMTSHTISGLNVDIKDFENKPLNNISNVQLTFTYGNNSQAYGGYSGPTNATADFKVDLIDSGNGITFSQTGSETLMYAGSWTTTFSFKVGDTPMSYAGEKLPTNAPVYTVSSVAPAITLKARSTYEGSSVDGNTITVTYRHSTETTCGITYHNYGQAHVTFTLSGYGNANGATLTFKESSGGEVRLFLNEKDADNKRVDNFSWTGNGDCKRWVGYWNSQTGSDRATAAGTITATELVLTYGGANYTVDIDDITIINPTPPS